MDIARLAHIQTNHLIHNISLLSAETVAYFNIRVQQEGLNHSVLETELYGKGETVNDSAKYSLIERADKEFV